MLTLVSRAWLAGGANDAVYLKVSTVFVFNTTELRRVGQKIFIFLFFKVLAGLTRLTWLTLMLCPHVVVKARVSP
jgi:hypothetical protein